MNQHVRTVFEFDPKGIGRPDRCGIRLVLSECIARCVCELIVVGNHSQDLGFPRETKSVQKVACDTSGGTVVDTGRELKGCVIIGDSVGRTASSRGGTPGSKSSAMKDVRFRFPFGIAFPIPIGNIDTFTGRFLQQLFEVPNEPSIECFVCLCVGFCILLFVVVVVVVVVACVVLMYVYRVQIDDW